MKELRKCKGTHKHTYGLGCGKEVEAKQRKYGLGKECGCYSLFLRTTKAGREIVAKATFKAKKPRLDLEKAKSEHIENKKLQNVLDGLKNVFHKFVRLRDENKPCISCGANWNRDFQAGHFYKAELYPRLRFHKKNVNGQCRVCNLHKDGNFEGYRSGIEARHGLHILNQLDALARLDKMRPFKWDRTEIRDKRKKYNIELNRLK